MEAMNGLLSAMVPDPKGTLNFNGVQMVKAAWDLAITMEEERRRRILEWQEQKKQTPQPKPEGEDHG